MPHAQDAESLRAWVAIRLGVSGEVAQKLLDECSVGVASEVFTGFLEWRERMIARSYADCDEVAP